MTSLYKLYHDPDLSIGGFLLPEDRAAEPVPLSKRRGSIFF